MLDAFPRGSPLTTTRRAQTSCRRLFRHGAHAAGRPWRRLARRPRWR